MTIKQILDRITFYTGLDENIFSASDRLVSVNIAYDKLHSIILESQDEWDFDDSNYDDLPIAFTNLTASQGTYLLPDTLYKTNKIEINYGSGLVKAMPLDLNETNLSESEVLERVSVDKPYYRIFGRTIKFYPTPTADVTSGIQVYYDREVESFTDADVTTGTKEPGFDRLFHDYIAIQASIDAGIRFNTVNKVDLSNLLVEMEGRISKFYGDRNVARKYKITNHIEDYE